MKSKILDLEINEEIFKIIFIVGVIAILLFCLSLYLEFGTLREYTISEDTIIDNSNEIEFNIDNIFTSRKYIEIEGWAYKKGQNIGYFNNRFIIQNEKTGEYKACRTKMEMIEELFSVDGEFDCRRARMYAKPIAISLKKGKYRLFIEYKNDDENMLVDTGKTFVY